MDRERTPWLVVVFHVPWYNSNYAHQGEDDDMMASMEPLLYAAGVDVVFAGHVHAYERSVSYTSDSFHHYIWFTGFWLINSVVQQGRVYNGKTDTCGPIHITIGDGGNREGLAHE